MIHLSDSQTNTGHRVVCGLRFPWEDKESITHYISQTDCETCLELEAKEYREENTVAEKKLAEINKEIQFNSKELFHIQLRKEELERATLSTPPLRAE